MKFWFSHRHPEAAQGKRPAKLEDTPTLAARLHSLVVSSNSGATELLLSELEGRGHAVEACASLDACRTAIRRLNPDLALIDWRLDQEIRAEVLQLLKSSDSTHHCAVLALVEQEKMVDFREILHLGAHDLLGFPIDTTELDLRLSVAERQILDRLIRAPEAHSAGFPVLLSPAEDQESMIWEWHLDGARLDFFGRWASWSGDEAEAPQNPDAWLELVHPADREQLRYLLDGLVAGERGDLEHCVRMHRADGTVRHVLIQAETLKNQDRSVDRVVGRQTDIGGAGRLGLAGGAHLLLDPLTRLASRTVLMDRLRHAFARASRPTGKPFAVLFFDLDRFKNVNDGLGHLVGDQLLCAIAERVGTVCRPSDTVCRFGGDEFVLVAEDVDNVRHVTAIADRLHREFVVPFDVDGAEVYASISTGIAMWHSGYEKPEDLLRDADNAMYRAKAMGRNRYSVFDEKMHAEVVATLALENDLRRAVARGEFKAYYQPIIVLDTGRLAGFEALVRWQHPERGLLLPGAFIAVAEEMGVAVQLDRIIAEEACRQLRAWEVKFKPDPPLTMSINISTTQFLQPDLVTHIDHTLRQNGLYGSSLKLEVTESVLMENTAHASAMLDQLRTFDIAISIDDFGTGYSSLSYLRRFEIDSLKIDYSFVSRMLEDEDSSEIVRTIANLAKNLGKETVAEGVETRSQLEFLRKIGVERVQGFFVAPPLPPEEIEKILELIRYEDNHLEAILFDRVHPAGGRKSTRKA